jgi:hypothetical protein
LTTELEPDETQALREGLHEVRAAQLSAVAPRDFSAPRRLPPERVERLTRDLAQVLPAISRSLGQLLRRPPRLALIDAKEVGAARLADEIGNGRVLATFTSTSGRQRRSSPVAPRRRPSARSRRPRRTSSPS